MKDRWRIATVKLQHLQAKLTEIEDDGYLIFVVLGANPGGFYTVIGRLTP